MTPRKGARRVHGFCGQCGLPAYMEYRPDGMYCSARCVTIAHARETQEAALETAPANGCAHHWLVDNPVMGEQKATCKKCGDETVFRPVYSNRWTDASDLIDSIIEGRRS